MEDVIKVRITQKDIDGGMPESACNCPFALRLKAKGYTEVAVQPRHVLIDNEVYVLSVPAVRWIDDFDRGREVKPGTFTLRRDKNDELDSLYTREMDAKYGLLEV